MACRIVSLGLIALWASCSSSSPPPPAPEVIFAMPVDADATLRRIGLEAVCHAELRSDALRWGGAEKDAKMRAWLDRQIAHTEVRRLAFEELPALEPRARARALTRASADEGVRPCPLAELWRWRAQREDEPNAAMPCVQACLLRAMRGVTDPCLGTPSSATMEMRAQCELGCEPPRDAVLTAPHE